MVGYRHNASAFLDLRAAAGSPSPYPRSPKKMPSSLEAALQRVHNFVQDSVVQSTLRNIILILTWCAADPARPVARACLSERQLIEPALLLLEQVCAEHQPEPVQQAAGGQEAWAVRQGRLPRYALQPASSPGGQAAAWAACPHPAHPAAPSGQHAPRLHGKRQPSSSRSSLTSTSPEGHAWLAPPRASATPLPSSPLT